MPNRFEWHGEHALPGSCWSSLLKASWSSLRFPSPIGFAAFLGADFSASAPCCRCSRRRKLLKFSYCYPRFIICCLTWSYLYFVNLLNFSAISGELSRKSIITPAQRPFLTVWQQYRRLLTVPYRLFGPLALVFRLVFPYSIKYLVLHTHPLILYTSIPDNKPLKRGYGITARIS